jgi:hypothetical protein
MFSKKILDIEKSCELALDDFFQSTNIFLSETKKLKYILVIDEDIEFVNKIRKMLHKYKEKVSVVRVSTISEAKIFIKKNNNIQSILAEYKPQIIEEISHDTEITIPIVFVMRNRIKESLSDLFLDIDNKQNSPLLITALGF